VGAKDEDDLIAICFERTGADPAFVRELLIQAHASELHDVLRRSPNFPMLMNKFSTVAFAVAVTLTFGDVRTATAAAPLDKIVHPGFLGVTVKYAEFMISVPAMREKIDDLGFQRNTYERDDFYIQLGVKSGQVVSVGLYFNPKNGCDLDVSDTIKTSGARGSQTTFENYAWRGTLHFTDPQLPVYNACGEGTFNATVDGIGALDYVSVQLSADTYGPGSRWDAWRDLLRANGIDGTRKDLLSKTVENCPLRRFDAQAFNLLKDTRVTGIAFSRAREALQPACSGTTVWSLNMRG
jgi:hypothetical protein